MRQLYNTTELIGIKDRNITLTKFFQHETHIEIAATLDYTPLSALIAMENKSNMTFKTLLNFPSLRLVDFPVLFV